MQSAVTSDGACHLRGGLCQSQASCLVTITAFVLLWCSSLRTFCRLVFSESSQIPLFPRSLSGRRSKNTGAWGGEGYIFAPFRAPYLYEPPAFLDRKRLQRRLFLRSHLSRVKVEPTQISDERQPLGVSPVIRCVCWSHLDSIPRACALQSCAPPQSRFVSQNTPD